MAMEIHVLFRGELPKKAALETAMKELGFPLTIKPATGSLEQQSGFMPMRLGREKTGVEFQVFNGRSVIEDLEAEVDPSFDRVASFRWAGDETEMVCGLCAAAALAKLTNGVVLEEGEGKLLAPDEAVAMARENVEGLIPDAPGGAGLSRPASPIHVFFRGELPSKAALAAAMKRLSYALTIKDPDGSLENQRGFMPITLGSQETGVEFQVLDRRSAGIELTEEIDPSLDRVASFRRGAKQRELLVGQSAAAALAKLTNGIMWRQADKTPYPPEDAIHLARGALSMSGWHETKRPGTRPADIKRYLKPLLQLRSDLVLRDRLLLIRPVRHLLRGALLDRTSDKHHFRIWLFIKPLYAGPEGLGHGRPIHDWAWDTWKPHFIPLLFDSLAEDIFAVVGKLRTLGDIALGDFTGVGWSKGPGVPALVLAGERERAVRYVNQLERERRESWVKEQREFLDRDISSICAEYHAREAETAKALKLGDIWEPAPFGAEVPDSERVARTADPLFLPTPWIPRPPWLLEQAPEHVGEVRFAKDLLIRNDLPLMLIPLTREQAEERHRDRTGYAMFSRLDGGLLFVLGRGLVRLYGCSQWITVSYGSNSLFSISAGERFPYDQTWSCQIELEEQGVRIYDYRTQQANCETVPLTSELADLVAFPTPKFGEFDDLARRIVAFLRIAGFGQVR